MNFDITQVPFSCRGSYLALSQNEGEFGGRTAEPGLYLRTVRGAAKDPFLARLTPLCGGRPAAFAPQADPACLHLAADGADIDIAFADAATLLLRGRGAAAGLCLDFLSAGRPYTMLEPLPAAEGVYYASCYVSRTRLVLRAQRGRVCIDQAWNVSSADHARLTVEADGGEFLLAAKEIRGDGAGRGPIWAPATMLLLDGLWRCGERDFVRDMTRRFAQLVAQSGCAENFDARTGAGLRDRAYTWTASAMLTMAEEYLR